MKIQSVELKDLYPYYNNPRDNAAAVAPVMESIKKYGFVKPILCDKDGVIITGHTRYVAAFQLGLKFVPVIYSDMSDEQAKLFRIADNKTAEKSSFDEDKLIEELKKLNMPKELQAFFFEDIDDMMNFSMDNFNMPQQNFGTEYGDDYEEQEEETGSYSVGVDEDGEYVVNTGEVADDYKEEHGSEQGYEDPAEGLFQVKVVDGKKMMKVICPFCGNIEEIEID